MGQLIAVSGVTLKQSQKNPSTVIYQITETDATATACQAGGNDLLIQKLHLECSCSGTVPKGKYEGTGSGDIVANTNRVKCNGQSLLLKGDGVTISCKGTVTDPNGVITTDVPASVFVSIDGPNQQNVYADIQ